MPLICYRRKRVTPDVQEIVDLANEILQEYDEQGFDLTVRQLYYQFIARDLFPESWIDEEYNARQGLSGNTKNTEKNYKRLCVTIASAREAGLIDWDFITDRGRNVERNPHWNDPQNFIDSVAPQFKIDLWADQPKRVEVWVEKDALSAVLERACTPLDVPFMATKGYISASAVWDAAYNRFKQNYFADHNQEIVVLHLADHDPSGIDMTRDIRERLDLFTSHTRAEKEENPDLEDVQVTVERIALTLAQVRRYNPPPNPTKATDPRSRGYRAEYGQECWELDALDPTTLVELIQRSVRAHMDRRRFEARQRMAAGWREELQTIARRFTDVQSWLRNGGEQ